MHRTRLIAGAAIGAAAGLAVAATMASTATAAPRDTATGVVTSPTATSAAASAALTYWTPARMRAAKPITPTLHKAARPTAAQLAVPGRAGSATGTTTSGGSTPQVAKLLDMGKLTEAPRPAAFAYPFPYVRFPVYPASLMNLYPDSVNGKLFFAQNSGNFVCSATSVVAPSRARVWTAGHCVSDGAGHFDSSAVFVPAYNNGSAPFGVFPATSFTTATAWHTSHDFSRDLGAFRVGNNAAGQNLTNRVGSAGFSWNQSRDQEFTGIAYPAAAPFNGLIPWEFHAATATAVSIGSGPAATGVGSDFTGGSSGGSWRRDAGGAYVGTINGHNDFKFGSQPLAMYSPYFDGLANSVRCSGEAAGNACP